LWYIIFHIKLHAPIDPLLVISKENLDRQPRITTDLEPIWQAIQLLHLLRRQLPAIEIEVVLDTRFCNRLWNDRPSLLDAPCDENLGWRLAFCLGNGFEGLVTVERRVGASKARVAGGVNPLRGVVCDKLGRGVVWV
jgi:hypothetical protein